LHLVSLRRYADVRMYFRISGLYLWFVSRHTFETLFIAAALLSCSICLAASESAPATLSGRVLYPGGGGAGGVEVRVEEIRHSVRTGRAGAFRFEVIPPGVYTVRVLSGAQLLARQDAVALLPGEERALEFEVTLADTSKQSIVVTGSSRAELLMEAPVRTELVTARQTEALIKRTIGEALTATVPGVRVENNCQNCGVMAVRLNGLEGQYTQILEDGLPTLTGVTMVYGLDQIPTDFLEQIEVVKGGNSALYGPNAVAGVINLLRREPRANSFAIDTQTGWHKGRPDYLAGASAQIAELPGGLAGDFYFRGIRRIHIDRDRDGFTELPRRELLAGGATLYKSLLDSRARLVFGASSFDEFRRGGSQLDLPPELTQVTEQASVRRSAGFLRWNHTLTPSTIYSVNQSFAHFQRHSYYGADYDPNAYGNTRNPLFNGDYQISHQAGRHSLIGGWQTWWEHVSDRIPSYGRSFDDTFTNQGLYLQDEFRISPRLVLLGGFRADKSNLIDHWLVSPRANIRYGLTESLSLRAGVSTGFRAPAIFDEDLHVGAVGGEGFVIQRAQGLRPERSASLTASADYEGRLLGRRFQAGASAFSTTLRDNFLLDESEAEGFRLLERVNGSGSYVRGIDANLLWQLHARLTLRGGATFQSARFREPEPQFNSLHIFRTPNQYGFLQVDCILAGRVEFTTLADFTGSMAVPHYAGYIPEDRLERTRNFAVLSFTFGRTFTPWARENTTLRLYGGLLNATDTVQRDFDQGPLRDSGYVYGPTQMRQVTLGLTLRF
jgi:outer membrane receptor for ferrienterochelin and colicins